MNIKSRKKFIIILFLLQILVIIRNVESDFFSFLWYCDFAPGLLMIAFLMSNAQAVKGILNIGFFAQIAYTIIIFAKILFGITLFGFIFNFPLTIAYVLPTIIIHITTLIAFVAVYKEEPKNESLLYSLFILIGIYTTVILFTQPDGSMGHDYNFIFFNSSISTHIPYYTELWIPLVFIFVVLPTHFFQYLVYRLHSKRNNTDKMLINKN